MKVLAVAINLVYAWIYMFVFMRRSLEGYALQTQGVVNSLSSLVYILPFFVFLPLFALETKRANVIGRAWKWLTGRVYGYLIIGIGACLLLTWLNVPGIGWTWMTVGLMLCLLLLATAFLERVMPKEQALILAAGIASVAIGTWEIPFRFVAYYVYGTAYWPAVPFLSYGVLEILPTILGGIYIMWFYNRRYHLLNVSPYVDFLALLFIGFWIIWIQLGFWVDPIFNGTSIVYNSVTDTSYTQYVLYRGTKVVLNCLVIALMLPKKVGVSEFSSAEQSVLLALFRLESKGTKESTGYQISKEIGPGKYWPHTLMGFGTLYLALDRLMERKMVVRTLAEVESRQRICYQLTDDGRVAVTCRIEVHV